MADKILIIDDNEAILQLVEQSLQDAGYEVLRAVDGFQGLHLFYEQNPDLVILDVMMPHLSGWEVCERIRAVTITPIIILTAKDAPEDAIKGLELGADDYVKKPFHPAELLARIQSLLRRAKKTYDMPVGSRFEFDEGYLVVDTENRFVLINAEPISLTPREFEILSLFVKHPDAILTVQKIFEQVWPRASKADLDSVKWYVWRLRNKVEKNPRNPKYILTERGIGYRFVSK